MIGLVCVNCGNDAPPLRNGLCSDCAWEATQIGTPAANGHVRASDVRAEAVEWLWPGYVPIGMVTVFGGFPGAGKSTILYDLAARTSREGKDVLILTAEDHLAAIVRPRLEAARADLERVWLVTADVTLPEGLSLIRELVEQHDVALVTIDPLVAFIGETVNTHRDHHVRRVLAPIAEMAEHTRTAVVVVIHTNKGNDTEPLMRISGSIGFTGAARSVLLAAEDPQDESRRILAVVKSNLAELPTPIAFRLVGAEADGLATSRVEWLGEAPEVDIRELLVSRDPDERGAAEDAMELLRACGLLETPRLASEILREGKAQGLSERTVQRARKVMRIPTWRDGFGSRGAWYWGPRPNEVPIGANVTDQSLAPMASMDLPAGMDGLGRIGAKAPTLGEGNG